MKSIYGEGKQNRESGAGKAANPWPYMTEAWSWWLAGWNDRDMEIGND